jgi:hypothetical protein
MARREWLAPDQSEPWSDLRQVLLPPKNELWRYGGKMFAKFEDGRVYYQDAFGRTEKERDWLKKALPVKPPRPGDLCGCGNGRSYKDCCESKPASLRPAWTERGIRERNLMLFNALEKVLELSPEKDWVTVRRELTDEKIRTIYLLYADLWPEETDLLQLLPKPDGTPRAVYTGALHPKAITDFALGAPLYFGELLIQHPFVNARTFNKKYSPVENPSSYRPDVLKTILFFFSVMPLVERGLVNLIPDPCDFDFHLRSQMLQMARARAAGLTFEDDYVQTLMKEDTQRSIMSMPPDILRSQLRQVFPDKDEAGLQASLQSLLMFREHDPLAVLQEEPFPPGEKQGHFHAMKLAPNFEMAMYIAQATGSCIVTDSPARWQEIQRNVNNPARRLEPTVPALVHSIGQSVFAFPQNAADIFALNANQAFAGYAPLMRDTFKYLLKLTGRARKPNVEQNLAGRFARTHAAAQAAVQKAQVRSKEARISCSIPQGGIQDNTVNRLLLMSSSEKHLPNVPMAFFIEGSRGDE